MSFDYQPSTQSPTTRPVGPHASSFAGNAVMQDSKPWLEDYFHEQGGSKMKQLKGTKVRLKKYVASLGYAGIATFAWPACAFAAVAAGGALPWDLPLTTLQADLQGPVAHAITTAAVIGTGIMWSVSEHGTGVRKMSSLAFGGACALGATQLMTTLFPMGGALF